MFDTRALPLLACPICGGREMHFKPFEGKGDRDIREGVAWCAGCRCWFPIEHGILDLLTGALVYREDRSRFSRRHAADIAALELIDLDSSATEASELQSKQQEHFDWYAANEKQTYLEYEQMPFWRAADDLAFSGWRKQIRPGAWLLDVGCGNGRSTFKLADLDLRILAFDVSKGALKQAVQRAQAAGCRARTSFLAADASRFPLQNGAMDYVLVYGVLHHVPDPAVTCREIARVLKPGGVYFGSENNHTIFRRVFDVMQKLRPLWFEEAGPEALISAASIRKAFSSTGVEVATYTSVFVPPHVINLLPRAVGRSLLAATDGLGRAIPGLTGQGGLIVIRGTKNA